MPQAPASSGIADLTYRSYDGPLDISTFRWWVIGRAMIRKAFKMKSLWVLALLSGWYFLVMIVILFFLQQFSSGSPDGVQMIHSMISKIVWKDQFFHGFGFSQHLMLVVALLVGAGSIANDNRANALLVYLSKPCTKLDYLLGKWIGIFVPILVVVAIPTSIFYLYGAMSFRDVGFISADPWLFAKVLAILPLAAAVHASLILMASSLFKQGAVAGAVYAGVYFMSYFFTLLMEVIFRFDPKNAIIGALNYASIDGIQVGLAKTILKPITTNPFLISSHYSGAEPLPTLPYLAFVVLLIVGCIWVAWTRIRAVEVV